MRKIVAEMMILAALAPLAAASATMPTTEAADAYGVGQSYVRLFQDSVMPGTCGIVLERTRCRADLQIVRKWRGNDSTDASFAQWLADGDSSLHTSDWNGYYIAERAWIEEPTFAWWYTGGIVSIAIDQPKIQGTADYLSHYLGELVHHPNTTPLGFQDLILRSGTPFEQAQPLARALDAAIPVAPYPAPSFGAGLTAAAQLGAYLATLMELVDNPLALSRPESRAFATLVLTELGRRHRELSDGLSVAELQNAVTEDIPSDPEQLNAQWREPLTTQEINTKWPEPVRYALLLGQLVAQVAYNAAVLKDAKADASFRGAIAQLPRWPAMTERTRSDIAALQSVPYASNGGSWKEINQLATRATLDLTGAQ